MNKRILAFAAAAGLAVAGLSGAAAIAQNRDAASLRASGQVGEQADGLMGCVSSCDAETRAAVEAINEQRRKAYRAIDQRNNAPEGAAGQAAGRTLIAALAPGQYYKPLGGSWTRK